MRVPREGVRARKRSCQETGKVRMRGKERSARRVRWAGEEGEGRGRG